MKNIEYNEIFNLYDITEDGKCINKQTGHIKQTFISNSGYERVTLWNKGKQQKESIHRLVAIKYIKNPNGYNVVNHKDGNKLNNHKDNLEWTTTSKNTKHAYQNNLINTTKTKVVQYTRNMEKIKVWNSIKEASKELNLNHANIVTVCKQNTNRKYVGGYIWRYL